MTEPGNDLDVQPVVTPAEESPVPNDTTPETDERTVAVRVAGPLTYTGYTSSPTAEKAGIHVDEYGVEVPESQVEALIAEAAQYGVHLVAADEYPTTTEES